MKKSILLTSYFLFASLFSTTQSIALENSVSANQITGEWKCLIVYDTKLNLKTLDKLEFDKNGTSFGIGYIFINNEFVYETSHTGNWTINNDILSETGSYTMISMHPDFIIQRLKADKNYAEKERQLKQHLLDGLNSNQGINFKINQIEKNQFTFDQLIGDKKYAGSCKRLKTSN
ncbi:hypothetical protein EV697_101237 [Bisgaardia hudsonensis]|uniref:Lipocalin-like protein n=1 Tax=Bisgaardia hudsonensis TaxID=109472 RepID=A0A4R2N2L9_9PAST|nr:hypothetical protein [Bisgaardia hudsonensis]QLB12566.1 hypothetical protein A6A11_02575 [Bisgaardia hudsonensis]TCP14108.1 hypothetical protein EV697_101237 [Bisgaardia hudsonensis]